MEGWIKLYRSISNKAYYKKDSEKVHLWIHLLLKAAHTGREETFRGKPIFCKPGQFTTGRKQLSDETGIHESKVERILKYLEVTEQQIEQQKSNINRLITILNWNEYQFSEQQTEQQSNSVSNEKNKNLTKTEQQNKIVIDSTSVNKNESENNLNNNRTTAEQRLNTLKECIECNNNIIHIGSQDFFVFDSYSKVMNEMLSDTIFLEQAICMNMKISLADVEDWVKKFFVKLTSEGNESVTSLSDARQYFSNWLRFELDKQSKQEKGGNNGTERRKGIDISAINQSSEKTSPDYSERFI